MRTNINGDMYKGPISQKADYYNKQARQINGKEPIEYIVKESQKEEYER